MKSIRRTYFAALVLLTFSAAHAQSIGDRFVHTPVTAPYADRLLIIDFFTTGCANCIAAIPKLNALQQQFDTAIQILIVSPDPDERIKALFARNKYTRGNALPVITEDTILSSYFRHRTVPHIAWVHRGEVMAITEGDFVQEKYIQAMLDGEPLPMALKNDFDVFDPHAPLAADMDGYLAYSLLQGYREGAKTIYGVDTLHEQRAYRHYIINAPITGAFFYADKHASAKQARPIYFKPSRMVFEGVPKERFVKPDDGTPMAKWQRNHHICYEAVLPDSLSEQERWTAVRDDLNMKLSLSMRIEERSIPCLVVQEADGAVPPSVSPAEGWTSQKLWIVLAFWDMSRADGPPIVDAVGGERMIWTQPAETLEEWQEIFQLNGLSIVEQEYTTQVFVAGTRN